MPSNPTRKELVAKSDRRLALWRIAYRAKEKAIRLEEAHKQAWLDSMLAIRAYDVKKGSNP